MKKPKTLTQMFNERVGISKPTEQLELEQVEPAKPLDTQDKKDFLMEQEGRYIYDAGMSEAAAMRKAQEDLSRLEKERK